MAKDKDKNKSEKKNSANGSGHHYRADSIQVLEGLEPVRKRPGMYIGTTGPDGLHHLITEIFDNSRDEAMGGFANDIEIALLPENRVRVADNGRGIPVDTHKQTKVSALETIMTTLHAGGKFGGEGYKVSGGLHGVGASVVNALSRYCKVVVHRDGGIYVQEYGQGDRKAPVKKIGKSNLHGTIVIFEPDPVIFPQISFDFNRVVSHMREQAYLVRGLRILVIDLRAENGKIAEDEVFYIRELALSAPSQSFYFEGGLLSLVKFYNQNAKPVHKNIFYVERKPEGIESVEISLQYIDDITSRVFAFANNISNPEGGTHVTGFKTALTRTINTYARKEGMVKESEDNFTGEDVLEGLTAVISVKLREIQFEGQTKAKLGSVEAQSAVATVFAEAFAMFLEEHPDDARAIIGKVLLALKARKAAKAAKDSVLRKGALEGMTLPGKLADCETKSAEESELFIVEGDSAGGCFSADTKVALVDGRDLSFSELILEYRQGKKNYCYTINSEGRVAVAPIEHPRLTRKDTSVVKVILDNGEEITCTPDHRFLLRDGKYKEACLLTAGDSIMPLRRQLSKIGKRITIKGYELVYDPKDLRWIFTHLISDRYNLDRGLYEKKEKQSIHHKDFNKRNNNPDNLTRMGWREHFEFHTSNLDKTIHTEQSKQKSREARNTKEYRDKIRSIMTTPRMRQLLRIRAVKQWKNEEYKQYMVKKFLEFYRTNEEYRKTSRARLLVAQRNYWASDENRIAQSKRTTEFFEKNPKARSLLHEIAIEQWGEKNLLEWRSATTKKQWTPEFRSKRKVAYNQTYLLKCLKLLSFIYKETGRVDREKYDQLRKQGKDKSVIRFETIADRFFNGEIHKLEEAAINFNHKVLSVIPLKERIDVYDLEVPNTHNFALAGGVFVHNSGKQGRDRMTQAVLPLKGKILNVERARLDKILGFAEIKYLVIALGTAIGDTFDISKLRYHKIIIATDADVDGAHIRTLLLTLFYRYFRPLIDGGFIYIAQPPLYKIKRGKEVFYAYSDDEKSKILGKDAEKLGEGIQVEDEEGIAEDGASEEGTEGGDLKKKSPKINVQRYKGLGEMNPEELWETTMDPARRVLKQVKVEDAIEADKVFEVLMGDDVPSRKSFIQSNAKKATVDL